jgi:hypothetical protein
MEYVGIDEHKKESQICLLTGAGEMMECRIRTEPQRFAAVLGGRPRTRILVEGRPCSSCYRIAGNAKWKVAPRCTFGVAHSRPPCASTMERLIDSPMPMPPGLVLKKALNSRSRS